MSRKLLILTEKEGRELLLNLWDLRDDPKHFGNRTFTSMLNKVEKAFPKVNYNEEVEAIS